LSLIVDAAKPNMAPLIRKYAFHMILAGHRFGKSGQKRHASRAYQLALQVCPLSRLSSQIFLIVKFVPGV
jgi:hypothetical protein